MSDYIKLYSPTGEQIAVHPKELNKLGYVPIKEVLEVVESTSFEIQTLTSIPEVVNITEDLIDALEERFCASDEA